MIANSFRFYRKPSVRLFLTCVAEGFVAATGKIRECKAAKTSAEAASRVLSRESSRASPLARVLSRGLAVSLARDGKYPSGELRSLGFHVLTFIYFNFFCLITIDVNSRKFIELNQENMKGKRVIFVVFL